MATFSANSVDRLNMNNISVQIRSLRKMKKSKLATAVIMVLLLAVQIPSAPAIAGEPTWPSGPYMYVVIDQDIRDTLREFGHNVGVQVKVSDQIPGQRIRGKLPTDSARTFLDALCESYAIVWFYDSGVLYFSAETEVRAEQVNLGVISADTIIYKITDPRFPIKKVDWNVISISGPPPYVSSVRQTLANMQKTPTQQKQKEVTVFRAGKAGN
jgi:type II secretory pathway component GspD/PulD (secretin)